MSLLYASSTATVPGAVKEEVAVAAAGTVLQGIGPEAEAREESRTERASEAGPSSMSRMSQSGAPKLVEAWAKSGAGSGAKAGSEAEAFPSELHVVNLVGARGRTMAEAGAGAGTEAGSFPSEPNVVNPVGARAKSRAWAGAEAGAEVRTEAGFFLSVAAEEDLFDEVEAAVAEEDWTMLFVKLVAAICGRIERKVEEGEEEEVEEEEKEKEEERLMSLRLVSKAPEKFGEKSSICRLPTCCIRNKSSFFLLKGFTPGTASLLCIKARKSTSVIVGKRQEEAAAEIAE